jgi:hypothetical protein
MEAHYDQFIGYYPKAVSAEKCNRVVNYFEQMVEIQASYTRQKTEKCPKTIKNDFSIDVGNPKSFVSLSEFVVGNIDPSVKIIMEELSNCFNHYTETYDTLLNITMMSLYHKVQKTLPQGGYHIWHCEQGSGTEMRRILVYTLYLNDVEEGGETEFLYQQRRIPARKGDVCIFPAHFTHPHRGNPPLSGEKYIMTGWLESVQIPDNMKLVLK